MISAILGHATVSPPGVCACLEHVSPLPGVAALSLLSVSNPWLKKCDASAVHGCCARRLLWDTILPPLPPASDGAREKGGTGTHMLATQGGRVPPDSCSLLAFLSCPPPSAFPPSSLLCFLLCYCHLPGLFFFFLFCSVSAGACTLQYSSNLLTQVASLVVLFLALVFLGLSAAADVIAFLCQRGQGSSRTPSDIRGV